MDSTIEQIKITKTGNRGIWKLHKLWENFKRQHAVLLEIKSISEFGTFILDSLAIAEL